MAHLYDKCFSCQSAHREASEKEILDDTKWIDDFQNQQGDDELAKTANEFLSTVDDPKLTNSEV